MSKSSAVRGLAVAGALVLGAVLTGCSKDADVASENLSTAADHYRVIFKPEAIVPNIDLQTSGG